MENLCLTGSRHPVLPPDRPPDTVWSEKNPYCVPTSHALHVRTVWLRSWQPGAYHGPERFHPDVPRKIPVLLCTALLSHVQDSHVRSRQCHALPEKMQILRSGPCAHSSHVPAVPRAESAAAVHFLIPASTPHNAACFSRHWTAGTIPVSSLYNITPTFQKIKSSKSLQFQDSYHYQHATIAPVPYGNTDQSLP